MAFISVDDGLTKRSKTAVENKFILKYLPELEPEAVKVYLFCLYLYQNGQAGYGLGDLAKKLNISEEKASDYFRHLEELELVDILSTEPFEVKILDCENYYGRPKKLHPEKYEGLYDELQSILSDRMISQDEFREYLILLEECGMERNALVMICSYCVDLKGDKKLPGAYIRKVAKSFQEEGIITAAQVEEKLSSYTACTSSLSKIFSACGIKRKTDVEDGERLTKWQGLGFSEDAIVCAAKGFKTKNFDKLDAVIGELYKNKKFDVKEIDDYRKNKESLYNITVAIAKSLGIYAADPAPYVENYGCVWCGYGFSGDALIKIANYCFLSGRNTFDLMNDFVKGLYDSAFVDDESVEKLLNDFAESDKFIKKVLGLCGLTRKIISYDRQALARWRDWGFNEAMILKAAEMSAGKNNPVAAMNYLLSTWKNGGVYTVEQIPAQNASTAKKSFKAEQRERDNEVFKNLYNKLRDNNND